MGDDDRRARALARLAELDDEPGGDEFLARMGVLGDWVVEVGEDGATSSFNPPDGSWIGYTWGVQRSPTPGGYTNGRMSQQVNNIVAGNTTSPNGYYTITVAIADAQDYTITATPRAAPQTGDSRCKVFTLSSTGQQAAQDAAANNTTQLCWGSN